MDKPQVVYGDPGLEVDHSSNQPIVKYDQNFYPFFDSEHKTELGKEWGEPVQPSQILGLQRQTFWFIVIITTLLIGAGVGGGIGGSLAVQNAKIHAASNTQAPASKDLPASASPTIKSSASKDLSASPTITSDSSTTLYTPLPPSAVARIDNSCPSSSKALTAFNGDFYKCTENTNYMSNDIVGLVAYTFQACVDACSTMNEQGIGKDKCAGVVLDYNLNWDYANNHGANCWLKFNITSSEARGFSSSAMLCKAPSCS